MADPDKKSSGGHSDQKTSKLFTDYVDQSKYITPRLQPYFPKDRDSQDVMLFIIAGILYFGILFTEVYLGFSGFIALGLPAIAPILLWVMFKDEEWPQV